MNPSLRAERCKSVQRRAGVTRAKREPRTEAPARHAYEERSWPCSARCGASQRRGSCRRRPVSVARRTSKKESRCDVRSLVDAASRALGGTFVREESAQRVRVDPCKKQRRATVSAATSLDHDLPPHCRRTSNLLAERLLGHVGVGEEVVDLLADLRAPGHLVSLTRSRRVSCIT